MRHFANLSGGAGSWAAASRLITTIAAPGDQVYLVFADTKMEDEDLYRFLDECVANLEATGRAHGVEVKYVYLADGRDVWQVFHDEKFMGNSMIDPCSKILKRKLIRRYLDQNFDPADTHCYLGIDWSEEHRFQKAKRYWEPYTVLAPLCDPPYLDKNDVLASLTALGIEPPRLYAMGFAHNNCGGFCVKAGQGHFKLLLEKIPERYAYHEAREQQFRETVPNREEAAILKESGLDAILRHEGLGRDDIYREDSKSPWLRRDNDQPIPRSVPLTLHSLRKRVEEDASQVDDLDIGGCACFTPDNDDYEMGLSE